MPDNETQITLYVLIAVIATIIFIILFIKGVFFFISFKKELRLINMEIRRTEGKERERWLRRKRRLWLSIIPFVKY